MNAISITFQMRLQTYTIIEKISSMFILKYETKMYFESLLWKKLNFREFTYYFLNLAVRLYYFYKYPENILVF